MSVATDEFVKQNQNRFLAELKDFVRIPSISTLPEHQPDIARAAGSLPMACARPAWRMWRSSPRRNIR